MVLTVGPSSVPAQPVQRQSVLAQAVQRQSHSVQAQAVQRQSHSAQAQSQSQKKSMAGTSKPLPEGNSGK